MKSHDLLSRLAKLEVHSRKLHLDADTFQDLSNQAIDSANKFALETLAGDAYRPVAPMDVDRFLPTEEGADWSELISMAEKDVAETGLLCASEGHLGYIPGGGLRTSALGDMLAAVYNVYAGLHFASPGAVQMENAMIKWLCGMVGYPEDSYGNLSSGGSIANLMAVTVARDQSGVKAADYHRIVIYLSEQTHHCVHKAIRIAGLGEAVLRDITLDNRFRMDTEHLASCIREDLSAGLLPMMVVASAGTTDTGAIDPLDKIADLCEVYELWYHIDAAYGGTFMLVDELRSKFAGIERSDSLAIDPHKGLFLPYGLGALLMKDRKALHDSHFYKANYMQDALHEMNPSSADFSPELTKHFRGMRMWMSLSYFGVDVFRRALEEKYLLCRYFYERIGDLGFELGPYPQLSVCIYRYAAGEQTEAINQALIKELHADGRVFISSTLIHGETWLRMAILSFRTHQSTIDMALSMLERCIPRAQARVHIS